MEHPNRLGGRKVDLEVLRALDRVPHRQVADAREIAIALGRPPPRSHRRSARSRKPASRGGTGRRIPLHPHLCAHRRRSRLPDAPRSDAA